MTWVVGDWWRIQLLVLIAFGYLMFLIGIRQFGKYLIKRKVEELR